ncbi:MAG: DUF2058 domain-containing protein [Ectothiorhodospiraceae bacterium]|nr:DUF2058 domain-containing protein [Ectothiorhodospiraceae bacterium]MCH8505538.1 DUF2058 domain-containing protein [Ectothiorhodospiraceae bacterium]
MSDALREQLLKAGLADEKKAREAQKALKQKQREQRKGGKKAKAAAQPSPEHQRLAEERRLKAERDRALNQQKEAQKKQKSAKAQIEDLLKRHGQSTRDGEIPFHFTEDNKVRKLEVTPAQQQALSAGRLAIVRHAGRYHVVPADVLPKLLERDGGMFSYRAEPAAGAGDEDDPYKDFPIPDDLHW